MHYFNFCCVFEFQIALGTVTNVEEAVKWISYTYLYVRMRANPLVYGISHKAYQVENSFIKKQLKPFWGFCNRFMM
jgi:replicative superfamily II helicase